MQETQASTPATGGSRRARLSLYRGAHPESPSFDRAIARALLDQADGNAAASLWLHRPARAVLFGRQDALTLGYGDAQAMAARHGFASVARDAGGRAAVLHEGTIAFTLTVYDSETRARIRPRYHQAAGIVVDALRALGVEAGIGPVPGEFCPGDFSVNARGQTKLAGLAQRLARSVAQVGGVVVTGERELTRTVLEDVYAALGISWEPRTVGSVADEAPGANWDTVAIALTDAFGRQFDIAEEELPRALVARAYSQLEASQ